MSKETVPEVIVKTSPIHGCGLYAVRPFRKGEIVLQWANARELSQDEYEELPESERIYIEFHRGKILLMGEPERFMNHSCDANTAPGDRCDIACRDIEKGEELTSDYAKCSIPTGRMSCVCGSPKCRRIIIGKDG
jgi:SET domain-containing protein